LEAIEKIEAREEECSEGARSGRTWKIETSIPAKEEEKKEKELLTKNLIRLSFMRESARVIKTIKHNRGLATNT